MDTLGFRAAVSCLPYTRSFCYASTSFLDLPVISTLLEKGQKYLRAHYNTVLIADTLAFTVALECMSVINNVKTSTFIAKGCFIALTSTE